MNPIQTAFSFRGRIGRGTFWLAYFLLFIGYMIASAMLESYDEDTQTLGMIIFFALLWPSLAISAKRWHDRDKSGWWILINIIPFVGPIWSLFEQGILPGTKGLNRFDPGFQPEQTSPDPEPADDNTDFTTFLEIYGDLIALLAKMAKCDGAVSQPEIEIVGQFFDELFSSEEEKKQAIYIFRESKDSSVSFEKHARIFRSTHAINPQFFDLTIEVLFTIAMADGEMSAEEEMLLNMAESILGVRPEAYASYKASNTRSSPKEGVKDIHHYAAVLGLSSDASYEEIRGKYKELVRQYHPDKVAHLGDRLKDVAHEEIQKINEAYEFLKKARNAG